MEIQFEKIEIIPKIKVFFEVARLKKISLGYLRGSCFSEPILRALINSEPYFLNLNLVPEIWENGGHHFGIDVEFERGKELINIDKELKVFRSPIVDIINNCFNLIGHQVVFENWNNNSKEFLDLLKKPSLELVWGFDEKIQHLSFDELFKREQLVSFQDFLNVYLLTQQEDPNKLKEYQENKNKYLRGHYNDLSALLKGNFGSIIYHEDIIEILYKFLGWNHFKCDLFRRSIKRKEENDLKEFKEKLGIPLSEIVLNAIPNTFSKAHVFSLATMIKKSLILRNFYPIEYIKSIKTIENKFNIPWNYFEK